MLNTTTIKNYTLQEYLTNSIKHFSPADKVEPTVFIYYARGQFVAQQFIRVNGSPIFIRKVEADSMNDLFKKLNYTGTEKLDNLDKALKASGHAKINSISIVGGKNICDMHIKTLLKGTKRICKIGTLDIDEFLKYSNNKMGEYIQNCFKITAINTEMVR